MGSHLSHDRAKELGMMEVPDMATVPWKVNDIVENRRNLRILRKVNEKSYFAALTKQWDQFEIWHGLGVLEICNDLYEH